MSAPEIEPSIAAKLYDLGFQAGDRAGYARAVEDLLADEPDVLPDPTGVDPVVVEACRRLIGRHAPSPAHRHHWVRPRARPRFTR